MALVSLSLSWDDGDLQPELFEQSTELVQSVKPTLEREYRLEHASDLDGVANQIAAVLQAAGPLDGKRFLDLGSGSQQSEDDSHIRMRAWEPWFCRTLHALGHEVIGIDSGYSREQYRHIQADLCNMNPLGEIADDSVDVTTLFNLHDSPALRKRGFYQFMLLGMTLQEDLRRIMRTGWTIVTDDPKMRTR